MPTGCFSHPVVTKWTILARSAISLPGRNEWNRRTSMADIVAQAYRVFPIIPALKPGAMEGSGPYVSGEKMNEALGFPGKLVDDWHDKAIAKMGDLLGKYRSLKVYMDSCVHCGACSDKCHYLSLIHISETTRRTPIS